MQTLTTPRLTLRPWQPDDADAVLDIYSRWDVMRFIGVTPRVLEHRDEALERVERWVAADDGTHGVWAVVPRAGEGTGLPDADLLALARDVPAGSEGLVVLPYLLPERAPLWDPDVAGAVLGLRRRHGAGHLVRAAVEGVAVQLAAVVDAWGKAVTMLGVPQRATW